MFLRTGSNIREWIRYAVHGLVDHHNPTTVLGGPAGRLSLGVSKDLWTTTTQPLCWACGEVITGCVKGPVDHHNPTTVLGLRGGYHWVCERTCGPPQPNHCAGPEGRLSLGVSKDLWTTTTQPLCWACGEVITGCVKGPVDHYNPTTVLGLRGGYHWVCQRTCGPPQPNHCAGPEGRLSLGVSKDLWTTTTQPLCWACGEVITGCVKGPVDHHMQPNHCAGPEGRLSLGVWNDLWTTTTQPLCWAWGEVITGCVKGPVDHHNPTTVLGLRGGYHWVCERTCGLPQPNHCAGPAGRLSLGVWKDLWTTTTQPLCWACGEVITGCVKGPVDHYNPTTVLGLRGGYHWVCERTCGPPQPNHCAGPEGRLSLGVWKDLWTTTTQPLCWTWGEVITGCVKGPVDHHNPTTVLGLRGGYHWVCERTCGPPQPNHCAGPEGRLSLGVWKDLWTTTTQPLCWACGEVITGCVKGPVDHHNPTTVLGLRGGYHWVCERTCGPPQPNHCAGPEGRLSLGVSTDLWTTTTQPLCWAWGEVITGRVKGPVDHHNPTTVLGLRGGYHWVCERTCGPPQPNHCAGPEGRLSLGVWKDLWTTATQPLCWAWGEVITGCVKGPVDHHNPTTVLGLRGGYHWVCQRTCGPPQPNHCAGPEGRLSLGVSKDLWTTTTQPLCWAWGEVITGRVKGPVDHHNPTTVLGLRGGYHWVCERTCGPPQPNHCAGPEGRLSLGVWKDLWTTTTQPLCWAWGEVITGCVKGPVDHHNPTTVLGLRGGYHWVCERTCEPPQPNHCAGPEGRLSLGVWKDLWTTTTQPLCWAWGEVITGCVKGPVDHHNPTTVLGLRGGYHWVCERTCGPPQPNHCAGPEGRLSLGVWKDLWTTTTQPLCWACGEVITGCVKGPVDHRNPTTVLGLRGGYHWVCERTCGPPQPNHCAGPEGRLSLGVWKDLWTTTTQPLCWAWGEVITGCVKGPVDHHNPTTVLGLRGGYLAHEYPETKSPAISSTTILWPNILWRVSMKCIWTVDIICTYCILSARDFCIFLP